ncbi:TniQ family protein [Paenibacillus sedimenti]|uniref:TniQ family protein n=1 Tax=Paenibacillus sedimenti TaxID=2770274 RepID=A0A926QK12_9BACL|nr:TniQ family protein [Paenibacillus sedimenti]MBD0380997.1 TniQ family protein [Paenibacillus sedimenti]
MKSKQLLINPSIIEDESLEGFIVRLSYLNGYKEIDDPYKFLYYYRPYLDVIRASNKKLANYYIYYDLVEQLTGQVTMSDNKHNRKYLSQNELLLGHGNRWYPAITRFCPLCLCISRYHRINWSMIPVIICEKHFCYLQHKCNKCLSEVNLKALVTGRCSYCENDITAQDVQTIDQSILMKQPLLVNNNYFSKEKVFLHLNAQEAFRLKKWLMYCILQNIDLGNDIDNLEMEYSKKSNMVRVTDFELNRIKDFIVFTDSLLLDWPKNLLNFIASIEQKNISEKVYNKFFMSQHFGKMRIFNFLNRI